MTVEIKRYNEDGEFEIIKCDNLLMFLHENHKAFSTGYRLFENGRDITQNAEQLMKAKKLVMQNPYQIAVAAWGAFEWIMVGITVASAAMSIYTMSQIGDLAQPNRSQKSATNSLGSRSNEPAIGSRIDDIWGRVNGHTPRLASVPRFDYIDNQEVEKFSLYIGQGKLLMENVRDGKTDFSLLTNGKFNAWYPNGNPNHPTNRTPDLIVGGEINEPLQITELSTELQATELAPPNDLAIGGVVWSAVSDGSSTTFTATNYVELEIDLTEVYTVGENLSVANSNIYKVTGTTTLFGYVTGDLVQFEFDTGGLIDLSGSHLISSLTESTVTISTPSIEAFADSSILLTVFHLSSDIVDTYTIVDEVNDRQYFSTIGTDDPVTVTTIDYSPRIGKISSGYVGAIRNASDISQLQFNFVANNGFYQIVKGNDKPVSAQIEVVIQELDEDGNETGNEVVEWVAFESNVKSIRSQSAISFVTNAPYQHSQSLVRRSTDRDKSDNVVTVDNIQWRDLYFRTDITDQDYGDITFAQVEIPYSIASQGVKERRVNMDVTRFISPYIGNGNFGTEQPIDTVAEVVTALALDKRNGRLSLNDIDADLYLQVQNQLVDYYGTTDAVKVGFDFDSTTIRFQDQYLLLWNAVLCKGYAQGAKYKVYPDIKRTQSSKQFTHRNKIPDTDSRKRTYRNQYDGVELTYRDNKKGDFEQIILHANGVESFNRKDIELSGAVNLAQATIRANRELNMIKYQRETCAFEGDGIARLSVIGERVDNVDNTRIVKRDDNLNTYNVYDGEIVEVSSDGLTVELSQPVVFEVDENHSIRFTDSYGELMEAINCTAGATPYHVVLSKLPSKVLYSGYDMDKSSFTFASDASRLSMPWLIIDTESMDRQNIKTRQLSLINWDEKYYERDQDFRDVITN